jgi:hypothetical protein
MNDLGTLTFTIPIDYSGNTKTINQQYLNNYENPTSGFTATSTSFTFVAIGTSRLSELKQYGSNNYTQTLTTGTFEDLTWTGYTIGNLTYQDFSDGTTQMTGTTPNFRQDLTGYTIQNGVETTYEYNTGNTTDFAIEYVINNMLTREEHFLGFVEQPRVYSDIFVNRGKQGVLENNLRLGEIDNMGELSIYGNKYFTIKKQ